MDYVGSQITAGGILKFYLYLTTRDGCFLLHPTLSTCLSWGFVASKKAKESNKQQTTTTYNDT